MTRFAICMIAAMGLGVAGLHAQSGKELTITLKNDCAKNIQVFAGPKKKVFEGKSQTIGGASVNTIHVMVNDVVCIMSGPKTIQACAPAKPGTTKMEVNKSGNNFVK